MYAFFTGIINSRLFLRPVWRALFCALLLAALPASAQTTYTIEQPLSFGGFAISDNNGFKELIVDRDGNATPDPAFIMSTPAPQNGELFLQGLDPNVPFFVTFQNGTMSLNGSGASPVFTIRDFTTNAPLTTNPDGTLTILYGATLRTSGSGQPYPTGTYSGSYDVIFNY